MMLLTMRLTAAAGLAVLLSSGPSHAEPRATAKLLPPVGAGCISSPFGPRVLPNLPQAGTYHYGIDLPAADGAPVLAAAPGTVIRIQTGGPGGLEMLVQHAGFVGVYSHLGKVADTIGAGRVVAAGEKLGVVGQTGVTMGGHLYFEMIMAGRPVDPAPYLGLADCKGVVSRAPAEAVAATPDPPSTGPRYFQIFPDGSVYRGR